MKMLDRTSLRIAHVEDDAEFARLTRVFLERAGFNHSIAHYVDGRLAINDLQRSTKHSSPHAVLLDLHMPDIDGHEVLRRIRQTHSKSALAVFMLTSSTESQDIWNAAANGANSYLVKTHSFMAVIERLDFLIEELNNGFRKDFVPDASSMGDDVTGRKFVESEKTYA